MPQLTIKKSSNFVPARNKGTISLLKTLNVPSNIINSNDFVYKNKYKPKGLQSGSFWQRNEGKLEYLLQEIKECYLKTIKEFHPDKGGDLEKSKIINSAWHEIKKRFNNRLNPRLYIRT